METDIAQNYLPCPDDCEACDFVEACPDAVLHHKKTEEKNFKPLFIPLNTKYYNDFKSGLKNEELRQYGPRWNHETCVVGRPVILSKGYGKQNRMIGKIWKFKKQHGSLFGATYKEAIKDVFGKLDVEIACISITDLKPVENQETL